MNEDKCLFYEVNAEAMRQAEEMEKSFRETVGEAEWLRMEQIAGAMAADAPHDPCGDCYGCKHFCEGEPGFPGETVYACRHPETPHIIHIDFDPSAVI